LIVDVNFDPGASQGLEPRRRNLDVVDRRSTLTSEKNPLSFVWVERVTPEATSMSAMRAFGIIAPDLSSTDPVSVAVPFCARAMYPGRKTSAQARPTTAFTLAVFIDFSSSQLC
jgi:hypothetical protein